MSKIKISVVTVVYNDVIGIKKTIDSVVDNYRDIDEYIVIDGGSTDGTIEVVKQNSDYIDFFVSEKDFGIYNAMNKGWIIAKEENYIVFLNSADYFESGSLQYILDENNKGYDVIHGLLRFFDSQVLEPLYIQGRYNANFRKKMIEHPTCFVRKSIFHDLNGFDESYKSAADYDFIIRAKLLGAKFKFVEKIISNFDVNGISSSSKVGELESNFIRRKYGFISKKEFMLRFFKVYLIVFFKKIF